jgi:Cof subfamily protein (haloacid dehalogenase superfamily)
MGKFDGYLLVSDLDGTLLNRASRVPASNARAISYFVKNGGKFSIATGRTELTCLPLVKKLPINAPLILYNGSLIYDLADRKQIWTNFLDRGVAEQIVKLVLAKFPRFCVEIYGGGPVCLVNPNGIMDEQIIKEKQPYQLAELRAFPAPWLKIVFAAPNSELQELARFLAENLLFNIRQMFSGPNYYEILPPNSSKGICLENLMTITGISRSKVIAIGDYYNDLDLIVKAGMGVTVANAPEEIKARAALTVCDNNDGAVAELIRYLDAVIAAEEEPFQEALP